MSKLRLLWQKDLLALIIEEFDEMTVLVSQLQKDYPDDFYTYPGNKGKDRVPTKSYQGLIRYLTIPTNGPPFIKHFASILSPNKEKSPLDVIYRFSQSLMATGLKVEFPRYNEKNDTHL